MGEGLGSPPRAKLRPKTFRGSEKTFRVRKKNPQGSKKNLQIAGVRKKTLRVRKNKLSGLKKNTEFFSDLYGKTDEHNEEATRLKVEEKSIESTPECNGKYFSQRYTLKPSPILKTGRL